MSASSSHSTKKKGGGALILWAAVALTALLSFGQIKKMMAEHKASTAVAERSKESRSTSATVNLARQTVLAPSGDQWTDFIFIPPKHRIRAYPSIDSGHYRVRCKDHAGRIYDWSPAACEEMEMVQFQATARAPYLVAFEFFKKA